MKPEESATFRYYAELMEWADKSAARWACAPTPTSPTRAANAIAFGAEGIGLCRTEHMFFEGERIMACAR